MGILGIVGFSFRAVTVSWNFGVVEAQIPVVHVPIEDHSYHRFNSDDFAVIEKNQPMVIMTTENSYFGSLQSFGTGFNGVRNKFIVPLQNGIPVVEKCFTLGRSRELYLTADQKGDFALPLYPLPCDIKLVEIHKNALELFIEEDWRGVLSSQKRIIKLDKRNLNLSSFLLENGDYATVAHKDIRILIKVGFPEPLYKDEEVKKSRTYRANPFSFISLDKYEKLVFAGSAVFSILLFAILTSALYFRTDLRPKRFEDLDKTYILPFINQDHFTTSPEVLQEKLNRSNYINSILKYYRSAISIITGRTSQSSFLPESTINSYKKMYRTQKAEITRQLQEVDSNLEQLGSLQLPTALSFAVVRGESFQERNMRLLDKIDLKHYAAMKKLELRSALIEQLLNDTPYDWTNYKEFDKQSNTQKILETIKSEYLGKDSNEEAMYKEASDYAEQANFYTTNYLNSINDNKLLESPRIIVLPSDIADAIHTNIQLAELNDQRFLEIPSSEYIYRQSKKIKEPLVGRIDPKMVERVISRKRFQLQLCYELALRVNEDTKGKMVWKWMIDTQGRPQEVELISSNIRSEPMRSCILRKLSGWKFPKPSYGSVIIQHAFLFTKKRNG